MTDAKIKKMIDNVNKVKCFMHIWYICHFKLENCLQFIKFIYIYDLSKVLVKYEFSQ